jgi:hypothetical protein
MAISYCNLGDTLSPDERVQLPNGISMSKEQLYLKAIELEPGYGEAYSKLADTLPPGGSIGLNDGTSMTKEELYQKAIDIQSN